jgi:hypothetical protein
MELEPRTVKTTPKIIIPKLKDCWVVLAAFSLADKSPHATLPSSFSIVTAFRFFAGCALLVPRPVWVAYNRAATIGLMLLGNLSSGKRRGRESMVPETFKRALNYTKSSLGAQGEKAAMWGND